jgi:hypothetical protein
MTDSYGDFNPDVLVGGHDAAPRRSKLPATLSIVGVVVVVVAAGGGLFAYHKLAATGSMPDTLAPASSIAFAQLDLDPSASEKISAYEFEQKFPSLPTVVNADALKDTLLNSAFAADSGDPKVDYATQIKPWLGDRVAIDEFVDAEGQPQTIGILQLKDAGKAAPALTQLTDEQGGAYLITGSYAIVGATKTAVEDAATQAAKSTIEDNTTYTKDVATLASNRLLTLWWDAGATSKALAGRLDDVLGSESQAFGAPSVNPSTLNAALGKAGRVAIGLRLTSSSAELQGRVLGSTGTSAIPTGNAVNSLGSLPSSTIGGVSVANPGAAIRAELAGLQTGGSVNAELQKFFDQASSQLGIAVPGDIENLLGSSLSAGVQGVPASGSNALPPFTVIAAPTNLAAGATTAQQLVAYANKNGVTLTSTTTGNDVVVSTGPAAGDGTLGDLAAFQSMFGSMPKAAGLAAYVNLTAVWAAEPAAPSNVRHLTGVGVMAGQDATSPVFDIKLTVG